MNLNKYKIMPQARYHPSMRTASPIKQNLIDYDLD